jgi:hypothetical protein
MVAVDLQALGGVGVQIEAAPLQCMLGRCNGVCMTADALLLPAQWSEHAQRKQAYAPAVQDQRDIHMATVQIMAVGAENGVDLIVAMPIAAAEHGDAEPPYQTPEASQLSLAAFEAAGDQQAQRGWQQCLRIKQALQDLGLEDDL